MAAKKPTVKSLTIQQNTERTVLAQWTWDDTANKKYFDHYEYKWFYTAGDAWLEGGKGSTNCRAITFDPPSQARKVQFAVAPVSTKKKVESQSSTPTYNTSYTTVPTTNIFQSGISSILDSPLISNNNITSGTVSQFISLLDGKSLTSKFYLALRSYIRDAGLANGKPYFGEATQIYSGVNAGTYTGDPNNYILISDIDSVTDIQKCLQKGWLTSKNIKSVLEYMSDNEAKTNTTQQTQQTQQTRQSSSSGTTTKEVSYFATVWSSYKVFTIPATQQIIYPNMLSAPTIQRAWNGTSVKVGGSVSDVHTMYVRLAVLRDNSKSLGTVDIKVASNQWSFTGSKSTKPAIEKGHSYKFKVMAASAKPGSKGCHWSNGNSDQSGFSEWSEEVATGQVSMYKIRGKYGLQKLEVYSDYNGEGYAVRVYWTVPDKSSLVNHYQIQYTTDIHYFNQSSNLVTSIDTTDNSPLVNSWIIDSLTTGTYYVRLRALDVNGTYGDWSNTRQITVGEAPSAPSAWQNYSVAKRTQNVDLQFTHNSKDGSPIRAYTIQYMLGTVLEGGFSAIGNMDSWGEGPFGQKEFTVSNYSPTGENTTQTKRINPFELIGGSDSIDDAYAAPFRWRVKTKGVYREYSPWSSVNTITILPNNSINLLLLQNGSNLPMINNTQYARYSTSNTVHSLESLPFTLYAEYEGARWIERQVIITALDSYETYIGGEKTTINKGQTVYKDYYANTSGNLDYDYFESEISYGSLSLENNMPYRVTITYVDIYGNTTIDKEVFITDFEDGDAPSLDLTIEYNEATAFFASITAAAYTTEVDDETGDEFKEYWDKYVIDVYRSMVDGELVRITDEAVSNGSTITDPHPHMDYARYRVVITDSETGLQYSEDVIGDYQGVIGVILQWDESYDSYDNPYIFESDSYDMPSNDGWNGTALHLMYNITKTEDRDLEVDLIKYIGRESPVSYYGTQINETANWKTEIPKTDTSTLEALRHLGRYRGDVYVRESSGNGYWANVKVSLSDDYDKVVIPVSLKITRVEGGA